MSRFPSHLTFDADPDGEQLAAIVGPDVAAARAEYREDDERITISLERVPFVGITVFVLTFSALLTSAPFVLPQFGYELPSHVSDRQLWIMGGMLWLLVVPSMIAVFWFAQRATRALGPGAIVDKRTGDLTLPWLDTTVRRDRLVRFVHMNGRRREHGTVEPVGQYCVIFTDEQGRFVYAPFARLVTRRLGRTPAQRLADHYDLRVQKVEAGTL